MSMRHQKFLLFRVYRFRDSAAYARLYDQYFPKIRRYVYFKVPKAEDTDELTAEVFLRGWEYATSSKVENPGALFYRIARNLIADFYRRRREEESLDQQEVPSTENLEREVTEADEQQQLIGQLRKLKEEYRDVLVMKYLDEMSVKEISVILEKTPNNVRVLLHRAKNALKEISESK